MSVSFRVVTVTRSVRKMDTRSGGGADGDDHIDQMTKKQIKAGTFPTPRLVDEGTVNTDTFGIVSDLVAEQKKIDQAYAKLSEAAVRLRRR